MAEQQDLIRWLTTERKISPGVVSENRVIQATHPDRRVGHCLAFQYFRPNEEKPYAAKFRALPKTWASTANVSRGVYNEPALHRLLDDPIVITEGEIDCLSVQCGGYERAISLPDGWGADAKVSVLEAVKAELENSPYVIVAGDNDEAGRSLAPAVSALLSGHDVRYVEYPDGCKDPNDVLVQLGREGLGQLLDKAKQIDPPGGMITGFTDLPPVAPRRVFKLSKAPFDKAVALESGELSVVTGIPGFGKSTFVTWLLDEIADENKVRVGCIAFETHILRMQDQLMRRSIGVEFHRATEQHKADTLLALDARWRIVHVHDDEKTEINLLWLKNMIFTLAMRDNCEIILIDPWNELEHLPERGESMTQYINWALKYLRGIAKRLNIHLMIVAHPAKMKQKNDGSYEVPRGYDVSDSAAWYNKPGLGLTIHPHGDPTDPDAPQRTELHTWKVRDRKLYGCDLGVKICQFKSVFGVFEGAGPDDPAKTKNTEGFL